MTEQPISGVSVVPAEDGGPPATFIQPEQPDTPAPEQPDTPTPPEPEKDEEKDSTDWVAHWRDKARYWERKATGNERERDQAKKSAEQRITELENREQERAGKYALQLIRTDVAKAGIDPDDVEELLSTVDAQKRFVDSQGEPDFKAIKAYTATLTRFAGRIPPDPDQGKTGGKPQQNDMNSLIRRAAGRR